MKQPQALRRLIPLALAALLPLLAPHAAQAHALLRKAIPAVGSTLAAAPPEMTLLFSEGVEPAFTTVEVHDAAGARVDSNTLHTAPDDSKTLLVGLKPLAPGSYTVEWHATSVDTHKTQGRFSFTIAP
jgi:methionine-rich copper-binding protein CopC